MEYKAVTVSAMKEWKTSFEKAVQELSAKVNERIQKGWKPLGGITVGRTASTEEPFLLQSMTKE